MGMKLAMIMCAVMITMGLAFSWYYKDTQERMGVLRENAAKLEVAVRANEEALAATQADAARNAALNLELQTKFKIRERSIKEQIERTSVALVAKLGNK